MQIKSRVHNGTMYVLLVGELDEHSANYTRITLDEMFDKQKFDRIVVDLSELSFMDSTGRFEYSLGQACSAYGEENVAAFIEKCQI